MYVLCVERKMIEQRVYDQLVKKKSRQIIEQEMKTLKIHKKRSKSPSSGSVLLCFAIVPEFRAGVELLVEGASYKDNF